MEDKFKDLLEDEELTALRLEALASKKRKLENTDNSSDSVSALPINSIVSTSTESASNVIPFVQSDRNAYNNYTWRKQNQSSRRRGGAFPKSNQRSNLIIISPVSLNEDKDSEDKVPALILPQHKWCNSGNEDSMSPKTLRRTGPTRFNRHGSDSDSSDSDYENSENDSGSNETVLQDEPPEHYSCLSPKNDGITDSVEKQRRLSFQNLDNEIQSDAFEKSETTSVYNCLKNSSSSLDYTKNKSDSFVQVQNLTDNRHDWNSSVGNEYSSYKQYNSGHTYSTKPVDSSESFVKDQSSCVVSNGESQISETSGLISQSSDSSAWQHSGVKASNLYYSRDISKVHENARNHGLNDRKSRDFSDNRQSFQMGSEVQGPESSVWKHGERVRLSSSYFSRDSTCGKIVPRNYCDDNVNSKEKILSCDDLRFELKKRMQDIQSKPVELENCNEVIDSQANDKRDRGKHRYIYEEDRIGDASHSNLYGNRQELNVNLRNRQERSFSNEREEHNINLNRRRHHRSLSRERNKQENSCARDRSRSEYNFGSERGRYDRSSSLDRSKYGFSSTRGRNRLDRSSSRGRFERSSSRGRFERSSSRSRFERSSSRGRFERSSSRGRFERSSSRGRLERSSSRGRSKRSSSRGRHRHGHECTSNKGKITYESGVEDSNKLEQSLNQDRNKREYSSSQERDKHDHSVGHRRNHQEQILTDDKSKHNRGRSHYERRYSPNRKEYARSCSRDRNKSEYWSSRNHSRSDRSSSHDSRDEHSSSSDSQHERSLSQDRSRHEYSSSQERSRHKRSQSRDRSRHKRSRSQDRGRHKKSPNLEKNRHERSQSQDSRTEHAASQDRSRRERSSSHDRNKHDHTSKRGGSGDDSSEIKSRQEHNSDGIKNSYKCSTSKNKSKLGVISGDEKSRPECTSGQENIESNRNIQNKKSDSNRNSERSKDDKRAEKSSAKEQFVTGEKNRQIRSKSKEKCKGSRKPIQKSSTVNNSEYEERYSRSRSSSTSRSSSSSSSSSHNLRPKIRSVPSVVKSFQPQNLDVDKKETFCEVKLTGKSISTSQPDDNFTSSRKDVIDYNKLSNAKCGRIDGDSKASDNSKRVPVHMRLGALPRKRLIQMPKDVEAAFVNSSSSSDGENVNTKCKRQNIRIVTDVYGSKSGGFDSETKHSGKEKSTKRSPDLYQEKSKRVKTHR